MGDPHPSRIASCRYCFKQSVQKRQWHSWSVVILSRDRSHRQSLQVTRGDGARSPGVGFSVVMVRQWNLPAEPISPSAFFSLLNPWREGSVPPGAAGASQQPGPRAPGRRSRLIPSAVLRAPRSSGLRGPSSAPPRDGSGTAAGGGGGAAAGGRGEAGRRSDRRPLPPPPPGERPRRPGPRGAWSAAHQRRRREPRVYLYRKLKRGTSYFPSGSPWSCR